MIVRRAKGKAYGREEDLWRGLDELEAPPSESPRDSSDAAHLRVLVSSTATPMQTGGSECMSHKAEKPFACPRHVGALSVLSATSASTTAS